MVTNFTKDKFLRQDFLSESENRETYQALLRNLKRREGFGIVFLQCTPIQEQEIIKRIKKDIPEKKVDTLFLEHNIDKLYNLIDEEYYNQKPDILFISGIEKSLVDYIKPGGIGGQGDYYRLDTVPPILSHLNLQRERFRDDFKTCFVFFVPLFALKYIVRRSPDFYDWRSGVFEFAQDKEQVQEKTLRYLSDADYQKYLSWTHQQRQQEILEMEDLIAQKYQTPDNKAALWLEVGNIYHVDENWEEALESFDKAIKIKFDDHDAWNNRGIALANLGRFEEAIVSFDKSLEIKPDYHEVWNNRGIALANLGRIEKAIASYDQVIVIKPDLHTVWYNRGNALDNLGRFEEALESFDKAIKIKFDDHDAWNNRGIALANLGRFEEAIVSFDKSLEIKPDYYEAWNNKGLALSNLKLYSDAIDSYKQAIRIQPGSPGLYYNLACCYALQYNIDLALFNLKQAIDLDEKYREMAKSDQDFKKIRSEQRFQNMITSP